MEARTLPKNDYKTRNRPPLPSCRDGFCNRPRRPLLALETVFDNFAIESAAADFENRRCLLLVPIHRFEHTNDVGALGIGERGEALPRGISLRLVCGED